MNEATIKVRNRETNDVRNITPQRWQEIQNNGFAGNYEVLEHPKVVPQKPAAASSDAKATTNDTN